MAAPDYIGAEAAHRVALRHLEGVFYRAKIELADAVFTEDSEPPHYAIAGSITPETRNLLARFLAPNRPYRVTARVHATEGTLLGYEVV